MQVVCHGSRTHECCEIEMEKRPTYVRAWIKSCHPQKVAHKLASRARSEPKRLSSLYRCEHHRHLCIWDEAANRSFSPAPPPPRSTPLRHETRRRLRQKNMSIAGHCNATYFPIACLTDVLHFVSLWAGLNNFCALVRPLRPMLH